MVAFGAQVQDRAGEQTPLDAGLDEQRQIAESQHLERDDRRAYVVLATDLGRHAEPGHAGRGQRADLLGDVRAVLLAGQVVDRSEEFVVGQLPGPATNVRPPPVEQRLKNVEVSGPIEVRVDV